MAKKPAPPPTLTPSPSSPSSSSSSEEESLSDEEQTNDTKPDPQKTLSKKQEFESECESESEESSDEEEEDEDEDQNLRPVSLTPSKPESESESEPEPEKIVIPSKPILEKSNGKSPFTRLWSVDDEITILEAMVVYQSKNGPIKMIAAGVKDFHESVRKSLSIDVGAAKLAAKMRRLWKKYMDANKKVDKIKFAKPHDKTIFELSMKVWGKVAVKKEEDGFEVEALNVNSSGVTVNKGKSLKREFPFIRDALGGNRLALEMLENVDVEKAAVLEKKFKKLKFAEINLIRKAYKVVCEEAEKLVN